MICNMFDISFLEWISLGFFLLYLREKAAYTWKSGIFAHFLYLVSFERIIIYEICFISFLISKLISFVSEILLTLLNIK